MNELSLFSGAGGGLLGSKILGWRTIGYVEHEKYCQEVIKQRISDGILDAAPIFGDIRKFISEGYAESYQGMVDIVTGGFPCQPFSVVGKGLGEADPRNMWPSTIACIRTIRPTFAFLENVPGLLAKRYVGRVFGDLAEIGYELEWISLGAIDVGANHRRKRLWILAYPNLSRGGSENRNSFHKRWKAIPEGSQGISKNSIWKNGSPVGKPGPASQDVSNTNPSGLQAQGTEQQPAGITGDSRPGAWWRSEPDVGRVVNGFPGRVDRLKALGNGQVPLCMAYAFSKLLERIV